MPEIVIVGGGVIGAATAYYLTCGNILPGNNQQNVTVTVLEEVELAAGASGKAGGFLHSEWQRGSATGKLAELSYQLHERIASEHAGVDRWQYRPLNTYGISAMLDANDQTKRPVDPTVKQSAPELSEWLDVSKIQMASKVGTPRTCSQVTPGLFTRELINLAEQTSRCRVVYGKCVKLNLKDVSDVNEGEKDEVIESVVYEDAKTHELHTLPASHVVFATGPWTGSLLSKIMPPRFDLGRITTVTGRRAHSIIVKESDQSEHGGLGVPNHALFTEIQFKPKGSSKWMDLTPEIYPRPNKTVYICGEGDASPLPPSADKVQTIDTYTDVLIDIAKELSPMYLDISSSAPNGKSAQLLRKQACYLPVVEAYNMSPIIDEIGSTNIFVATGHSVWGILNAPATGLIVAELVLTGRPSIDISRFAI